MDKPKRITIQYRVPYAVMVGSRRLTLRGSLSEFWTA